MVCGSALAAVEGRDKEVGEDAIMELMEAVDEHIPTPTRGTKRQGRKGYDADRIGSGHPAIKYFLRNNMRRLMVGLLL